MQRLRSGQGSRMHLDRQPMKRARHTRRQIPPGGMNDAWTESALARSLAASGCPWCCFGNRIGAPRWWWRGVAGAAMPGYALSWSGLIAVVGGFAFIAAVVVAALDFFKTFVGAIGVIWSIGFVVVGVGLGGGIARGTAWEKSFEAEPAAHGGAAAGAWGLEWNSHGESPDVVVIRGPGGRGGW